MRRGYVCADADGQTLTIHTHARMHARTHTHTHTHTHTRTHHTQDCRFLTHPAVNPFMSLKKDVAITDLKNIINRSLSLSLARARALCISLYLSVSLCPSDSLCLCVALRLSFLPRRITTPVHTCARALSHTHVHTLTSTNTDTKAHTHTHSNTQSHTHTHSLTILYTLRGSVASHHCCHVPCFRQQSHVHVGSRGAPRWCHSRYRERERERERCRQGGREGGWVGGRVGGGREGGWEGGWVGGREGDRVLTSLIIRIPCAYLAMTLRMLSAYLPHSIHIPCA